MDGDYLTFTGPTNYESQNSYDVDVIATDEDGAKDTVSLTIPVVDVNDDPELNSGDTGTVVENLQSLQRSIQHHGRSRCGSY